MCKSYCSLFTPVCLHASDLFKPVGLLSAQKNDSPWQRLQAMSTTNPLHDGHTVPSSGWKESYQRLQLVISLLLKPFSYMCEKINYIMHYFTETI